MLTGDAASADADQAADQVVDVVGEARVRRAAAQAALDGGGELLAGRREECS